MSDYRITLVFDAGQPKAALAQLEQVLDQVKASGSGVEATFEAVSKGAKKKQAELNRITRAYEQVRGQIDPTARATQQHERQQRILTAALKAGVTTQEEYNRLMREAQTVTREQSVTLDGLATAVKAAAAGYAAMKLRQFALESVEVTLAYEREAKALATAAGGRAEAARETEFLTAVTDRYGLRLRGIQGEYAKLLASAQGLARSDVRQLFEGTAAAGAALALTGEQVNGILLAYTQIAGKGRVQTEELNQIAERLPGTFDLVAKSMGMSQAELREQIESGQVLANDLLPAVGAALLEAFGPAALAGADDLTARINRLENAADRAKIAFGAGASQGLSAAIAEATAQAQTFEGVARSVGTTAGFLLGATAKWFALANRAYGAVTDFAVVGPNGGAASLAMSQLDAAVQSLQTRTSTLDATTTQFLGTLAALQSDSGSTAAQMQRLDNVGKDLIRRYTDEGREIPAALRLWAAAFHSTGAAAETAAGGGGGGGGGVAKFDAALSKLIARVAQQIQQQAALVSAYSTSSAEYELYVAAQRLGFDITDGLDQRERKLTEAYVQRSEMLKTLIERHAEYVRSLEETIEASLTAVDRLQVATPTPADLTPDAAGSLPIPYSDEESYEEVIRRLEELEAKSRAVATANAEAWQESWDKVAADIAAENAAINARVGGEIGALVGDAFADLVREGEFSFEKLMDGVLDMWVELLADMLAKWVAQQFTMNVAASASGASTAGSVAQGAGAIGGGGGAAGQGFWGGGASSLTYAAIGIAAVYMARETWQGQRYKVLADSARDVTRALNRTSDLLGRSVESGAQVWARGDGKGFRAGRTGDVFERYEDAAAALALMTLQSQARLQHAGANVGAGTPDLSERQLKILDQIDASLVKMGEAGLRWVERGLEVAHTFDTLAESPMSASFREVEARFSSLSAAAREYGFAQADALEWKYREIDALRTSVRDRYAQYLPGYDPLGAEFDRIQADFDGYNAQVQRRKDELAERMAALARSIAQWAERAAGEGGDIAEAVEAVGGAGGILNMSADGIETALGVLRGALEAIGSRGGGAGANILATIERLQEQLAALREEEARLQLLDQDELDEARRRARRRQGRSGPSREEQISGFNEELDRLVRSLLPDGQRELAELDHWLAQWTERANALGIPLDRVNELYEQQRLLLEEQAAAQEAAILAQRKEDLYSQLVSLGANPYDEIFRLHATMREALIDLRRSAEELGWSAEDVLRWTREIAENQMTRVLERMAQYLGDQELNQELLELRWHYERMQIYLQISLLEQQRELLGLTNDEIERMWGLFDRLPDTPPPGFGGGGGGGVVPAGTGVGSGSTGPSLVEQWYQFLGKWQEQGLSSLERDLSRIQTEFSEALAKFRMIPGAAAQLAQLQQQAIRDVFDGVLDRYRDLEVSPLQRELNELNETFAELIRLAPEYGYSLQEIREAQEAALAGFWQRALAPVRDFLDSFNLSNLSPLTPDQRLDAAQDRFDSLVAAALSGDLSALSQIPAAAQALLAEGAGMFGTSGTLYQDLWAMVQATLAQVLALDPNSPPLPAPGPAPGGGGGGGGISISGPGTPRDTSPLVAPQVHVSLDLGRVERGQLDMVDEMRHVRRAIDQLLSEQARHASAAERLARAAMVH